MNAIVAFLEFYMFILVH